MPVRMSYRPLPSRPEAHGDARFLRSAVDYGAAHRTSSIAAMARRVCSTMPGGDAEAAGAAGLGRAVADVDAAIGHALHERGQPIAGADENEVRVALPVLQSPSLAGGVQQRLRFARLPQVVLHMCGIGERRLDRHHRGDVHAVDRYRRAHGIEHLGRADEAADAQAGEAEGLRKRPPDDHVWKRGQLRNERRAGELGVCLVDEHHGFSGHAPRDLPNRVERHRHAGGIVGVRQEHHACSRRDRRQHFVDARN